MRQRRGAARWAWLLGITLAGCVVVVTASSDVTAATVMPARERPSTAPCASLTATPDASAALTIGIAVPPCGGRALLTPTPTPVPFPTGAATAAATGGTRAFVSTAAGFTLRYPEAWNVATQGSRTTTFSPETGATRIAGFLIEVIPEPEKTPEEDLRDALHSSGPLPIVTVVEPYPVQVAGIAALRAEVLLTTSDTTAARRGTPSPAIAYAGSLLVFEYRGVNYRIGVFAPEGDAGTLAQAEDVLATLHFP